MEKFLKVYGIILLSLLSVALAGLLIAGIVFMAPRCRTFRRTA